VGYDPLQQSPFEPSRTTEYFNDRDRDTRIMEAMEKKAANDVQVGGKHYKSRYQHWDFVNDMKLDYFEGCATKYITRRKGNRKEDLCKAIHFLNKRNELVSTGEVIPELSSVQSQNLDRFAYENNLTVPELRAIELVCSGEYEAAVNVIHHILSKEAW
jgi:hypothetical protein